MFEPSPSCPYLLEPQHWTPPAAVTAHVFSVPAARPTMPDERPTTSTGTGLVSSADPSPSSPWTFQPQHLTAPLSRRAHVCASAAAMAIALDGKPTTSTGTELALSPQLSPS